MGQFDITVYVNNTVMPAVRDVIPADQIGPWKTALRSAVLRDMYGGGKGRLMEAMAANPQGALVAVLKCAQLGLSPDPQLDHFALVPFGREIQGMVMYRGWIHLALESGRVEWVHADVIYKQEHKPGEPLRDQITNRVLHEPHDLERDGYKDEDIVGAYAMAKLRGSDRIESVVLSRGQINKRRAKSRAPNSPAWTEWFASMCCAKAYNALFRSGRVPLTAKLKEAITEEPEEVVVQAAQEPARSTIRQLPPSEAPPAPKLPQRRQSGDEVLYEALDKDPLPSESDERDMLLRAIDAEVINQDLTGTKEFDEMLASLVGRDAALEDLGCADLHLVLDRLKERAGDDREPKSE